ncbi:MULTISPECIES: hypothetical protein [Priestia]
MKLFVSEVFKNCLCSLEFVYLYMLLSFVELQVGIVKSLSLK